MQHQITSVFDPDVGTLARRARDNEFFNFPADTGALWKLEFCASRDESETKVRTAAKEAASTRELAFITFPSVFSDCSLLRSL